MTGGAAGRFESDAAEVDAGAFDDVVPQREQVVDQAEFDTGVAVLVEQRADGIAAQRVDGLTGSPAARVIDLAELRGVEPVDEQLACDEAVEPRPLDCVDAVARSRSSSGHHVARGQSRGNQYAGVHLVVGPHRRPTTYCVARPRLEDLDRGVLGEVEELLLDAVAATLAVALQAHARPPVVDVAHHRDFAGAGTTRWPAAR